MDRWQYAWSETAREGLGEAPYWPTVHVRACASLGCEREGSRHETYWVHFIEEPPAAKGKHHRCAFPEGRWRSMQVSSRWHAEVRVITGGLVCDSLKSAAPSS